MSTATVTSPEPIRNLGLLKVSWNGIDFHCTAKSLPSFKDAQTWNVMTDDVDEITGRTIIGKSVGLEPIELTIETVPALVYGTLLNAMIDGTQSSATFVYTPRSGTATTVTIPKCTLCGLSSSGGSNNSASTTIVRLQPEGGPEESLPAAS